MCQVFSEQTSDSSAFLNVMCLLKYVFSCERDLGQLSRYSDWLRAERPRDRISSPGRVKNFLFSALSRLALGLTQPPIQWVPGAISSGVKRPGLEADNS
jgi:hypothetical protein